MSKLITAKTGEIQDNVRKERERLTGEIRVMIEKNLLKDENQKLNELNSSLMNHSRFVENVFDETKMSHKRFIIIFLGLFWIHDYRCPQGPVT